MKLQILAAATMLSLPALLHAQGTAKSAYIDHDARYAQCVKSGGGARNATVGACSQAVAEEAAKEIAHLYSRAHAAIAKRDRSDAAGFEAAHKAWQSYRDTHCKLAGNYVGSPMAYFCPMQLNIARVKQLREFADAIAH